MKKYRVYSALRVSLIYALVGVAWTLVTDQLLVAISSDQIELSALQTVKDWSFVFISAILIFFLLRREFENVILAGGCCETRKDGRDQADRKPR